MESRQKKSPLNDYALYSNIGIEMVVIIALGVFGGIKLDQWVGSTPLFTLVLSLAAVAIALYVMINAFIPKKDKRDESKDTH